MEIKTLLEAMKIKVITVDKEEHYQKIGYLFGLKGFNKVQPTNEEVLNFEYELMMFHNFTKPRLDNVLKAMREKNFASAYLQMQLLRLLIAFGV